jgi:nitrite reductase/ring-hydroxylating ferredoxin subunit
LETNFVKVAAKNEIPVGKTKKIQLGDKEVLIANVNGNYYAIGARCTPKNGSFPSKNSGPTHLHGEG